MAISVEYLPTAGEDLVALYNHIANEAGSMAAMRYVERIERACYTLADFPRAGRRHPHAAVELRTIAFERRVVIAYHVAENDIHVARILYGDRDVERALLSLLAAPDDDRT